MIMLKHSKESTQQDHNRGYIHSCSDKFREELENSDKLMMKKYIEYETESNEGSRSPLSSSSEASDHDESPKSVVRDQKNRFVHHQVRKIREEYSHLDEDINDSYKADIIDQLFGYPSSSNSSLFWSRSTSLRSSPLRRNEVQVQPFKS